MDIIKNVPARKIDTDQRALALLEYYFGKIKCTGYVCRYTENVEGVYIKYL